MKELKKILIIQAGKGLYRGFIKKFLYSNITCPTIAASIPDGIEIEIIDMYIQEIDYGSIHADLALVTSLTTFAPIAFEVAQRLREKGITTVIGGVHAIVMPDECQQYFDCVAIGEAELLMGEILHDFKSDCLKKRYETKALMDLTMCRIPKYELLQLDKYSHYAIMASKGCAFNCDFCSSRLITGSGFRHKTTGQVVEEIKYLQKLHEENPLFPNSFFFVDSNLYTDRSFLIELLNALIPLKLEHLGLFASVNIAEDDEVLKLLAKANCEVIQIGFESINPSSLKNVNKNQNNPGKYRDVVEKLAQNGIYANGSFIFGFDDDNESIFKETLHAIEKAGFISASYSVLTPFPGTKLYDRLSASGRILHHDWTKYNMNEVVFQLSGMTEQELKEGIQFIREKSVDPHRILKCLDRFNETSGREHILKSNEKIALLLAYIIMFVKYKPQTRYFLRNVIKKGNLADYYLVNSLISAIQNP